MRTIERVLVALLLAALLPGTADAGSRKPGSLQARWPIKTSLETGSGTAHPRHVTFATLAALGTVPGVKPRDARYADERIPTAVDGLHEGDIVTTEGYVHLVAFEADGDYHIQFTDSPTSGNHCVIAEMPLDSAAFEDVASLRTRFGPLRQLLREKLLHGTATEFQEGGNWMTGKAYMSITGQLFFDDWHVGQPPRGKSPNHHAGHAATLWEIHPITDIRFAKAPR